MVGYISEFAKFGDTDVYDVTPGVISDARTLLADLYGKPSIHSLNILMGHIFATNKSNIRCLPLTENAFSFHLLRALYQLIVYKQAVNSKMHLTPATDFDRCFHNDCHIPMLMPKPPPTIVKVTFCKCSKQLCGSRCSCAKAGVLCTAASLSLASKNIVHM